MEKCIACGTTIKATDDYCVHCGVKLPAQSTALTLGNKIRIYALSVLLYPFGLYWFFKYFKSEDSANKKLAYTILLLSIIITVLLAIFIGILTKKYNDLLESTYYEFSPL